MGSRPRGNSTGCNVIALEAISPTMDQSTVEPYCTSSSQDQAGTARSGNDDSTVLDQRDLVPLTATTDNITSNTSHSPTHSVSQPSHSPASSEQLETIRVAALRQKLGATSLSTQATNHILSHLTDNTSTNRSYRPAQLAFIEWTLEGNISYNNFAAEDLVNFLALMMDKRSLHVNNLAMW